MATGATNSTTNAVPLSPDVVGGLVIAVLGLIHVFGLQMGGTVGFAVLLIGWPLVGGSVAARLSPSAAGREVNGALAGFFAALTVAIIVFLTGFAGVWPSFITENVGVALWPVSIVMLAMLSITWTVFGYAGGYLADRLA